MSSHAPLPSVDDFLGAFEDAVRVARDKDSRRMNVRPGSALDHVNGPAAMLWAQEAARDRALFRQCYTDTASGDRLEEIVLLKYGVPRVRATYGTGNAVLHRNGAAPSGTVYAGIRIRVRKAGGLPPVHYVISQDVQVIAAAISVNAPIRAARTGSGTAISNPPVAELEDSTFDVFEVAALTCGDGTDEESPEAYIGRARQGRRDGRPGHLKRFEDVCHAAGAANVVVQDAGAFGFILDFGVTHVYVADAWFSSPQSLIDACSDAIDAVHIAGCDVQILPMTNTPIVITGAVTLRDNPGLFDVSGIRQAMTQALLSAFNRRSNPYTFDADALGGEMFAAGGQAVQQIDLSTSPSASAVSFVPVLPRYTLAPNHIILSFAGPP